MSTLIGYMNLFESGTVTASSQATGFEKENAYDWRPYDFWQPAASSPANSEWLKVDLGSARAADYFLLHAYDLDGGTVVLQHSDDNSAWTNAFSPAAPSGVYMPLFTSTSHRYWRVLLAGHNGSPQIGVVSFGARLTIRGQQVGFVPPDFGRDNKLVTNQSEAGNFLGQSVIRKGTKFTLAWKAMTAAEARNNWLPFIRHAETKPFGVLWSTNYGDEAAFVWVDGGHDETPYSEVGLMDGRIECRGVVE